MNPAPYASDRGFRIGACGEHLEEISGLRERLQAIREDPGASWTDPDHPEERMEAHLDALVLGGETALAAARGRIREGDAGEFYGAIRLLARLDLREEAWGALAALDPADGERIGAWWQALREEMPPAWKDFLVSACVQAGGGAPERMLDICTRRRLSLARPQLIALRAGGGIAIDRFLEYFGALRCLEYRDAVLENVRKPRDSGLAGKAGLAALRLGDARVLPLLSARAETDPGAARLLGLGGGPDAQTLLARLARAPSPAPEVLLALGRLGCPESIDLLAARLGTEGPEGPSARALRLLTGALPGDAERKWARLCDGKHRMPPRLRLRQGAPCGPEALLRSLLAPGPPEARAQMADELAIRYGIVLAWDPGMPVRDQRKLLLEAARGLEKGGARFPAGHWYFAGRFLA